MVSNKFNYNTRQYLTGIRQKDPVVLNSIIREFLPKIKQFIRRGGGTDQDGEDIFQDAMEALYRKAKYQGLVDLRCSFKNFLYEICRRLLSKKLRTINRDAGVLPEELLVFNNEKDPQLVLEEMEREGLIWEKFHLLGEDCRRVLEMAYMAGKEMAEIAETMGYGSAGYAQKKKRKCMDKWKSLVRTDGRYEELKNYS